MRTALTSLWLPTSHWLLPLALLLGAVPLSAILTLTVGAGQAGQPTVAIYPPWWSLARSLDAAATSRAALAGVGPVDFMVIAVPDTAIQAAALRDGAVFLLNATGARLCGASPAAPLPDR